MAETIQNLKKKIATLEAEVKRLNKLIDTRYKSGAKPIAKSKLSSGQVLAIEKLKAQNERLTKLVAKKDAEIAEITKPKRAKRKSSSSGSTQQKSFDERIHHFNKNASDGKKLVVKIYGASFKAKPNTAYKVGNKVQTLSGRTTNRGKVPSILNGVIVEKRTTHCHIQTDKFGTWRSPYYAVRKQLKDK